MLKKQKIRYSWRCAADLVVLAIPYAAARRGRTGTSRTGGLVGYFDGGMDVHLVLYATAIVSQLLVPAVSAVLRCAALDFSAHLN